MRLFKTAKISLSFLILIYFIVVLGCTNSDSPDDYYTITFHKNYGSGDVKTQRVLKNTTVSLMPNEFERGGYEFLGWSGLGNVRYEDESEFQVGNQNVNLYALWRWIFEPLSEEMELQLKQDYIDIYVKPKAPESTMADVWIEAYYGTYDDVIAVIMNSNYDNHDNEPWETTIIELNFFNSSGAFFRYENGNQILIWKDGSFYELQEANERGWLEYYSSFGYGSYSNIYRIANYHAGLTAEKERQIAEDYLEKYGYSDILEEFWFWNRYYGNYNGWDAFEQSAIGIGIRGPNFILADILFGNVIVGIPHVWKDGEVYSVIEAYDLDLLRKEDVRGIAYYNNHGEINLENHTGVDSITAIQIIRDYGIGSQIEKYYVAYKVGINNYSEPIFHGSAVFAPYFDCVAVMMSGGNEILIWKSDFSGSSYYNGRFCEIQEAYDLGFITDDDIASITYYHETGKAISYKHIIY